MTFLTLCGAVAVTDAASDLQICGNGRSVQGSLSVATTSVPVLWTSLRAGRCRPPWQQCWQQCACLADRVNGDNEDGGATAQASASRSHLFGQMREIHGEDMHIVGRKLGEAYVPVEPGSPLVAMPDVQMQSM